MVEGSLEELEWNVENEGHLLDAMVGHKPVGVNKFFQMALICHKLHDIINKDVNPERIWNHLKTLYNLEALDDMEICPFPNSEQEFMLPANDFQELQKQKEIEEKKTPKVQQRRDSSAKEVKTEGSERKRRGRNSTKVAKSEEPPKPQKRTRNSFKANDDSSSSGKSSPVTIVTTPLGGKRRRI